MTEARGVQKSGNLHRGDFEPEFLWCQFQFASWYLPSVRTSLRLQQFGLREMSSALVLADCPFYVSNFKDRSCREIGSTNAQWSSS